MRLPFPERLPLRLVAVFAAIVCVLQQVEGTSAYFSICCFLFIVTSGFAFNLAGGFTQASGGYIFFYSMLTGIVGWVVKDFVGEAADTNLTMPDLTVSIYLGIMVAMTIGVLLSKKVVARKALLATLLTDEKIPASIIGCTIVGTVILLAQYVLPHPDGGILSFAMQTNNWISLGIVIGVTYEVRRSGGKRSLNATVVVAGLISFALAGLVGFSKLGIFTPLACYLLACAASGFRFSMKQVFLGGIGVFLVLHFLVPYAQYGRMYRRETPGVSSFMGTVEDSVTLMTTLGNVRTEYTDQVKDADTVGEGGSYTNNSQGLFDRLTMLPPDDGLIAATESGHNLYGLYPLWYGIYNMVPHFLWPDKPVYMFGNLYAHEMGGLAPDDFTTGISFSAAAQAYHMAGWFGVLVVAPLVYLFFFAFFDSLCGDVRTSPWGLLTLAVFANAAPEAMLDGCFYLTWHFGLPLCLAALACSYVMPIIGSLVIGPERRQIKPVGNTLNRGFVPRRFES